MNFFSVLDDSDNEEVKVVPKKAAVAAPAKKDATPAPAKKETLPAKKETAPSKKDVAPKATKTDDKPKIKESRPPKATVAGDAEKETAKDENRGGHRHRERHGEKQYTKTEGDKRPPRREFDRRSGTGRGREVSRGGRGAFGAGNPAQDALDAEKDPQAAIEGAVDGAVVEADSEAVVEEVVPAEPEPVTFSLDEYLQKRADARKKLSEVAGSVFERSVDREKDFAGFAAVDSSELGDYLGSGAAKADAARKDQRSTGKAVVSGLGFKFAQPEREQREPRRDSREGGRGGRREGPAGRGDRNSGRGAPRSATAAASFNAEKDFPKL